MEENKALSQTVNQLKKAVERYMSAEQAIVEYLKAPWWKRMFYYKKFLNFMLKQLINFR
jgi:hypothetical protein